MIPGMGGMDPKQMGSLLKQMGVKTTDLDAQDVQVHLKDGSTITIAMPTVTQIEFRGQKSFQISGEVVSEQGAARKDSASEDAKMVASQTGASIEQAQVALDEAGGDIAAAIMKLKGE